jgi:3',5'-cyclic AMP phosphodiesterase CpdA
MYNLTPGSTATDINVSWYSGTAGTKSSVRLYDAGGTLIKTATGTTSSASTDKRWHKASITGLTPSAKYKISVSHDETEWSKEYDYSAPPSGAFRFGVIADTHVTLTGDVTETVESWKKSIEKIAAINPPVNFIATVGDHVDTYNSEEEEYSLFFAPPALRYIPFAPAFGNHDVHAVFGYHFNLPNEQNKNSFSGNYNNYFTQYNYFYLYNNVLFVVLNTGIYTTNDAMIANLVTHFGTVIDAAKTANAGKYDWLVVQHHKSTKSVAAHAEDDDIKAYRSSGFETMMANKKVDVVLAGHDHVYVRTSAIDGTVYLTFLPTTNSKFYPIETSLSSQSYIVKSYNYQRWTPKPGYTIVDVSGKSMTFKTTDIDDYVVDEFTLTK